MNEEQKFDELINSKLSEREFPFDELNWDEAERLIIKQERWVRIKRVSLVFSAGLFLGVAVMVPFVLNNRTSSNNPQTSQQNIGQPQVVHNAIAAPGSQTNGNIIIQNSSNDVKAPLPVQSAFVKKDNSTGIRAASASTKVPHKKSKTVPVFIADNNSGNPNIETQARHLTKPVTSASAGKINKTSANTDAITPTNANPEKTSIADVNAVPVDNKDNIQPINSPQNNPVDKPKEGNAPAPPIASNPSPANNIVADNNSSPKNSTTTGTVNPTANKNYNKTANLKVTKKDKGAVAKNNSRSGSSNSLPTIKRDTIMAVERLTLPGTEQPYVPDYDANILSVYAGGNYSFGWKNNGTQEGSGITPLGGFIYTHYFNYRYSASVGLGYSELNKLDKTYTSSIIQYDFGQNADVTTVTPQRIYYLTMPFKFQVNINDKNMFSIGLDFLFMLTTASTLTAYQQSPFGQEAGSSTMQNGYTQGFSNYDFQFTGSYTYMITSRLGIRPEYYFGVNYIENKSFPGINQYERNSGVRLVLSYKLMK